MAAQGSYQAMLNYARQTGQAGTIDPVSIGGGNTNTYSFTPSGGGGGSGINSLLSRLMSGADSARKANESRYAEAKGKFETIEKMFAPGGSFAQAYSAFLASMKGKSVASGAQDLVSSGLYNTTQTAGLGLAWDTEVGAPAMLQFQEKQMGQYAQALQNTAGLIERREDEYPDYGMIAQLMMQANA